MTSICVCDPLSRLPESVAKEMKEVAWFAGWVEANKLSTFHGHRIEPDQKTMDEAFKRLLEYGMPTEEACHIFRKMAVAGSMYPAHQRMGDGNISEQQRVEAEKLRDELVKTKEVDQTLAQNLLDMCVYAGWHAANRRKFAVGLFHNSNADKDAEKVEGFYKNIVGEFLLYEVKFDDDNIVRTEMVKPRCCYEGDFTNNSDLVQTKKFSYKHGKSVTHSTSTTVKWEFTLAGAVGAAYFVGGALFGSMTYSKSTTQGVSFTDEEEKEYEYEFSVPPHHKCTARAFVEESEAKVPYFMIFRVGPDKKLYCKKGIWSGVMMGKSTYEVGESIPLD